MKKELLVKEISYIVNDIKLHIDCCNYIFDFIENIDTKRNDKIINLTYRNILYFYFASRNHMRLIILSLNTLLNPSKGEVSPYNKIMKLDKNKRAKLTKIKNDFLNADLHNYRNKSIAHKELLQVTAKDYNIVTDVDFFRSIEKIFVKFCNWFSDNYDYAIDSYFNKFFSDPLKNVLSIIELDREKHIHDFSEKIILK